MDDARPEPLLTLTQATKLKWLPRRRRGARPHLSTLLRWVLIGVHGVKLAAVRVGNSWCVTESELRAFFDRVAAGDEAAAPTAHAASRKVAIKHAEKVLDQAGVR